MDTPTPLQRQIEETVTNKRGYAPQTTFRSPLQFPEKLYAQFPKILYAMDVHAFLERQRLQDTLGFMEAQQSSPTLGDLFTRYLERILTDSPRPGSDTNSIEPNFKDSRMFSKITPFKEKLLNNNSPSDWERLRRIYAEARVPSQPTDSSSFPWDSKKSRSFREYMDSLRARQQDSFNPGAPFGDRPDPHAFDHLTSLEPRPQLPLKDEEFPYLKPFTKKRTPWDIPLKEKSPEPDRYIEIKPKEYIEIKPKKNFQRPPETPPKRREVYDILQDLPPSKPNLQFLPPPRPNLGPLTEHLGRQDFLDELLKILDREKKDPKPKKTE